jgi:co-chaperonin GroES (HSP10)
MSNTIALPPEGLILPPGVVSPTLSAEEQRAADEADVANAEAAKQLPDPKGYKILCALIEATDTYENSNLIKAKETIKVEEQTSPVLFVLKMGDLAYKDETKFPSGAWCKEGDFVLTRPYSGTRIMIYGKEFRVINDDQVEAVVEDPRGITRAY